MTSARPRLRIVLAGLAGVGLAVAVTSLACIIPDRDFVVFSLDQNQSAVRFVEFIPLDEEARCACDPDTCECPLPDASFLPTFLDPSDTDFQFCVCNDGNFDQKALRRFNLLAEDQDELDGEAKDALFAAILLDWDATTGESPFEYVAYRGFLDPRQSLSPYISSYETDVIKRPRPYARSITIPSADERFDLCNGAGREVEPGFHTFSVIVSDRYWYETDPSELDSEDETAATPTPITFEGVPNIAEGATYDVQTYVFFCYAEGDPECGCVAEEDP
ncbi:MAG: hypothetical protein HC927_12155 [Deltaproteobacteria bacterium]|nr:hypothetical protein [Deltaproteobacteria bacterium]